MKRMENVRSTNEENDYSIRRAKVATKKGSSKKGWFFEFNTILTSLCIFLVIMCVCVFVFVNSNLYYHIKHLLHHIIWSCIDLSFMHASLLLIHFTNVHIMLLHFWSFFVLLYFFAIQIFLSFLHLKWLKYWPLVIVQTKALLIFSFK